MGKVVISEGGGSRGSVLGHYQSLVKVDNPLVKQYYMEKGDRRKSGRKMTISASLRILAK